MKVVSIIGARPNFIKVAAIIKALKEPKREDIEHLLIHTGQHYDYEMSKSFFEELDIPEPDYNLEVGSGPQGGQIAQMLTRGEKVLVKEKPDWVLVYGDTNSTLAGALTAAKLNIRVGHIEAGLRSFNKRMPEEINRLLTDHISELLFCPTETAVKNLAQEGISNGVYNVGDVMYDSVLYNIKIAERKSKVLQTLNLKPQTYYLATIHRPSNTDNKENLKSIVEALEELNLPVIFPIHPRTKKAVSSINLQPADLDTIFIDPVSYFDMLVLEKNARKILTDSGGVQKEAYCLGVPCITLREETEWVETVKNGWNVLVGTETHSIIKALREVKVVDSCSRWPYGKGNAAKKVVDTLICVSTRGKK